jgi:glycosyltransferase involved in cell wall biosynthesis
VPLVYGAGVTTKVIEAMGCGTPVVASSKALGALGEAIDGETLLVANTPEVFADRVLQLIDDPHLQGCLSASGRRYVEMHNNWNVFAERLLAIYADPTTRG